MSAVRPWTTGTQIFAQTKSLLTHVLSNIVGDLDIKENEEQNSMSEEDLNNNIIIDSGS